MKDIEVLLRGFAMLIEGRRYAPSLVRFLNQFSRKCETNTAEQNIYLENIFRSFLEACAGFPANVFINPRNNRFNMALFEAAFAATCKVAFSERRMLIGSISKDEVVALSEDKGFLEAAVEGTTRTINVDRRLVRADALLTAL